MRKTIPSESIDAVTQVCGLPRHMVRDLLYYGWIFEDNLNEPPRWIHPMAHFKEAGPTNEVLPLEA